MFKISNFNSLMGSLLSRKGQLLATQVDFNNLFTDFIFDFKFRPFLTIKPEIVTLVLGDFLVIIDANLEIPAARTSGESFPLILFVPIWRIISSGDLRIIGCRKSFHVSTRSFREDCA